MSGRMLYFTAAAAPQLRVIYPEERQAIERRFRRGQMGVPHGTSLVRAGCFDRFGGYCEAMVRNEDLEFFQRIHARCRFHVLPEVLILYRQESQVSLWKWMQEMRYHRYALYRSRAASAEIPIPFDEFARRWGTRVALYTLDVARFLHFNLREMTGDTRVLR